MVQLAIKLLFALRVGYTLDIAQQFMILESLFAFLALCSLIALPLLVLFLLAAPIPWSLYLATTNDSRNRARSRSTGIVSRRMASLLGQGLPEIKCLLALVIYCD